MSTISCFPPIATPASRVLILGSMPGKESLRAAQYYAHPRNAFWKIMGALAGFDAALPYATRVRQIESADIAVWDVLASCQRGSSLDADIAPDSIVANDFASFFREHPHIERIFFNGTMAEQCFQRHVLPSLALPSVQMQRLPSTSPAHAALNFEQKLATWRTIVAGLPVKRGNAG